VDLPLGAENHDTHKGTGLGHFEEGQEVHALVVGLFQQRFYPPVVALHAAHTVQVAEHACYHSGDSGDGFEEDVSMKVGVSRGRPFYVLSVSPTKHT
jgi:hypothetical protein